MARREASQTASTQAPPTKQLQKVKLVVSMLPPQSEEEEEEDNANNNASDDNKDMLMEVDEEPKVSFHAYCFSSD